ncbi:permease [Clostridium felsineum]|uniref:Uncharacterized protein n=1 Tax=Clostridium felsineum TaxID=36839 RepID=A0A1S8L9L1_9CLOT|nr:permease [Clostridium felsineum]URZ04956.1 hypothetical protein CLROS_002800 [Clostridium felsineum]URZ09997.1 hypothetical protein CROST_007050 [Clostridium felsineum]
MKKRLIKAYCIGFLVFIIGALLSANLGQLFDGDSYENARAFIISFAVIFLSSVVAISTSLILDAIKENKNSK